jgi:phosphatidylglycerophosphatase A
MPMSSLLATFFGVGRAPAAGTVASAVALAIGVLLVLAGSLTIVLAALIATAVGVWASDRHCTACGICDSSDCVLDEVAGQWIAIIPIALYARPLDWRPYAVSFVLFRAVDILKLWPLSAAERLPGGVGVMADDVLAGLIAATVLWAALANGWI